MGYLPNGGKLYDLRSHQLVKSHSFFLYSSPFFLQRIVRKPRADSAGPPLSSPSRACAFDFAPDQLLGRAIQTRSQWPRRQSIWPEGTVPIDFYSS